VRDRAPFQHIVLGPEFRAAAVAELLGRVAAVEGPAGMMGQVGADGGVQEGGAGDVGSYRMAQDEVVARQPHEPVFIDIVRPGTVLMNCSLKLPECDTLACPASILRPRRACPDIIKQARIVRE
jgi:hypothetical protein